MEKTIVSESVSVEGIVQSNASETSIVRGVIRKATVGRPRIRSKDSAEQKKSKVPNKSSHKKNTHPGTVLK